MMELFYIMCVMTVITGTLIEEDETKFLPWLKLFFNWPTELAQWVKDNFEK